MLPPRGSAVRLEIIERGCSAPGAIAGVLAAVAAWVPSAVRADDVATTVRPRAIGGAQ